MLTTESLQTFFTNFLAERGIACAKEDVDNFNFLQSGLLDSFEILSMLIQVEMDFGAKLTPEEISDDANATVGGLIESLLAK